MPDQVGVPDPHPVRQPAVSALSYKEALMLDAQSTSYTQVIHQYRVRNSPGYTSPHLTEDSCQNSPDLYHPSGHPSLGHHSSGTSSHQWAEEPAGEDKPLSLVIRKNVGQVKDVNANVPVYTVHHKKYNLPFAPAPLHQGEDYASLQREEEHPSAPPLQREKGHSPTPLQAEDSYALDLQEEEEDNEEPPLVISEDVQYTPTDYTQDTPEDYSLAPPTVYRHTEEERQQAPGEVSSAAGIKIKDFAKFSVDTNEEDLAVSRPVSRSPEVDVSDVSSECTSLASDALSEVGRPYSGSDVIVRRISRASNGDTVYQCDFCDKMFANKSHFQSHLVTHTGERSFSCKTCQKSFGRKSTLRAHMTTHTKVSNFMCMMCEKACNDNNSLEEHLRMHTGEKPFVCSICEKAYARKSHLNVHYRVHTGERPFVCVHCDKDFTEKRFLNDHLQTAHNGAEGPLKCPNCAREFAYKTSLKQHLKKQMCERNMNRGSGGNAGSSSGGAGSGSGGAGSSSGAAGSGSSGASGQQQIKQFQCPFCDKSYSWKQTLKQHVSMYHRNKVHTDEFWRYELTKNRRSMVDETANDDLWKKQLGRHADEIVPPVKQEPAANGGEKSTAEERAKWLQQMKNSSAAGSSASPAGSSTPPSMSPNMKLLALKSLQNSLQIMTMAGGQLKLSSEAAGTINKPVEKDGKEPEEKDGEDKEDRPKNESYLSLLAQLACRGGGAREDGTPGLPTSEESASDRTQLWLAQVKQFSVVKEELWEQQIARVKANPVKSPLEPVEITLDDAEDHLPPPIRQIGLARHVNNNNNSNVNNNNNNNSNVNNNSINNININNNNNININNNDLNNNNSNDNVYNNNINHERLTIYQAQYLPEQNQSQPPSNINEGGSSNNKDNTSSKLKTQPPNGEEVPLVCAPLGEDQSMLKCLLLDRFKRKRTASTQKDEASKKSQLNPRTPSLPIPIPQPKDILRKRLLGWVDPSPCPSPPSRTPSRSGSGSPFTPSRSAGGSPSTPCGLSVKSERMSVSSPDVVVPQFSLEAPDIVGPTYNTQGSQDTVYTAAPDQTLYSTPHQTLYSTPNQNLHSTPHQIAYGTPHQNVYNTNNQTVYSTPNHVVYSTPNQTMFSSSKHARCSSPNPNERSLHNQTMCNSPHLQVSPVDLNINRIAQAGRHGAHTDNNHVHAAAHATHVQQYRVQQADLKHVNSQHSSVQHRNKDQHYQEPKSEHVLHNIQAQAHSEDHVQAQHRAESHVQAQAHAEDHAQAQARREDHVQAQPRVENHVPVQVPVNMQTPAPDEPAQVNYAQTSVLKHLLYRYNHNK